MKLVKYIITLSLMIFVPLMTLADSITFFPEANSQANARISLQIANKSANNISLKIIADKLSEPIFGLSFTLIYDPKIIKYQNYSPGTFFEKNTNPIYLISKSPQNNNEIVAGISLKRGDNMPQGSGVITTLNFSILTSGEINFQFQDVTVATLKSERENLKNIVWLGGKANIQQEQKKFLYNTNLLTIPGGISLHFLIEVGLILLIILLIAGRKIKKA